MTKTALENDFRVNTPNSEITVIISSCVDEEYKKSDALLKFCFGVFVFHYHCLLHMNIVSFSESRAPCYNM